MPFVASFLYNTGMTLALIRLKPREDRRLRVGHTWIFSNEIDTSVTPLTALNPGDLVLVHSATGRPLGVGYVNPRSLISVRLLSHDPHIVMDRDFFRQRVQAALALRVRLYPHPYYRLIFGEGDGLPGLVVDRYGDHLVVQITTAGMDRLTSLLVEILEDVVRPMSILLRNDTSSRALEGLPSTVVDALGVTPDEVCVQEGSARFTVSLRAGQKTGWFYDQKPNRFRILPYVAKARVLDLFSYVGGFGIQAALHGAEQVTLVDASAQALTYARANARANGVDKCIVTTEGDVFSVLKGFRSAGARFDVVICDPPALIKRRKDQEAGLAAYQRLNEAALAVLSNDGILLSASCSYHLERSSLMRVLSQGAVRTQRSLQLLEEGGQGPDHPVHPAIAETAYLKAVIVRALARSDSTHSVNV